ncbi:hypothetical protein ACLB2K_074521 [Fragaria x ananassa]
MYTRFNPRSSSWLCVGDFNEIQWSFEKWGGAPPDIWRIKLFQSFISNAHLRDLNFQGLEFTWFAMRNRRVYIKQRLDRAMANVEWCSNQTRTQVFHLPKVGSDHRPIFVDTLPSEIKGKPLFRYEQFWNEHTECIPLIREVWKYEHMASPMQNLISNLGASCQALKKWSQTAFPTSHAQVRSLVKDLEALYNFENVDIAPEAKEITESISSLWRRDELYWQQRSRISWLKAGDRNSKFFYQSTLQRRHFNKILRLKNEAGAWIHEEKEIATTFLSHFKNIFTSSGPQQWEEVIDSIDAIVSTEINNSLQAPISMEEVKMAVFNLSVLKAPGPDGFSGTFYQHHWETVKENQTENIEEKLKLVTF